jgi:hypothetical protein
MAATGPAMPAPMMRALRLRWLMACSFDDGEVGKHRY